MLSAACRGALNVCGRDSRGGRKRCLPFCRNGTNEHLFSGDRMNRRQVSALLVLRELGIEPGMEFFADRLSVQKSIYLAQAAGVQLGHHYNWYLRGPYSPSLTQDVFDAIENSELPLSLEGWELDSGTRKTLSALRERFSAPPNLSRPLWLELLASTHFLVDRKQVAAADADVLTDQLRKFGKNFTAEQVLEALRRLQSAGLLAASSN